VQGREIARWRMTLPPGTAFEATRALRQLLARAVAWDASWTSLTAVGDLRSGKVH